MHRFIPSFLAVIVACGGCAARQAPPVKAAPPQEIIFAGGELRTVVPSGWSGVKDAEVSDGELVTTYDLLLTRAPGIDIGIKRYPTSSTSALGLADRLHRSFGRLRDAKVDDLQYPPGSAYRPSFRYSYAAATGTVVGKVMVIRVREDLGAVVVGEWSPGSVEDAAAFEAVTTELGSAP